MKDYIDIDSITDPDEKRKVIETMAVIRERSKRGYWRAKRCMEIVLASAAIAVTAVPMLIIAGVVYLNDGANPIYKQLRVGRRGEEFYIHKFRTMVPNADQLKAQLMDKNEADGPAFKIKEDPRITRVGRFLRKSGLDELPQFFDVVRGKMCIIGPRPPLPEEVAKYTEYQKIRLLCTPGITCTWQVSPNRNEIPFEKWVEMDVDYIINRNIFLDIKIMFMTAMVMMKLDGR